MSRKKNEKYMGYAFVAVIALIIAYAFFKGDFNIGGSPFGQDNSTYSAMLVVSPNEICVGDSTTGSITTNIYNGICAIWVNINNGGWEIFATVELDSEGDFSQTEVITTPGTAVFRALCCDAEGLCKATNEATLIVNVCGPDSDGDGFTDEEEEAADTNPYDPDDYPGSSPADDVESYCSAAFGMDYSYAGLTSDDCVDLAYTTCNALGMDYEWGYDNDRQWCCFNCVVRDIDDTPNCNALCIAFGHFSGRGPYDDDFYCTDYEVAEYLDAVDLYCCCMPKSCDDWIRDVVGYSYDGFCGSIIDGDCVDWQGIEGAWPNIAMADAYCGDKCCYYD